MKSLQSTILQCILVKSEYYDNNTNLFDVTKIINDLNNDKNDLFLLLLNDVFFRSFFLKKENGHLIVDKDKIIEIVSVLNITDIENKSLTQTEEILQDFYYPLESINVINIEKAKKSLMYLKEIEKMSFKEIFFIKDIILFSEHNKIVQSKENVFNMDFFIFSEKNNEKIYVKFIEEIKEFLLPLTKKINKIIEYHLTNDVQNIYINYEKIKQRHSLITNKYIKIKQNVTLTDFYAILKEIKKIKKSDYDLMVNFVNDLENFEDNSFFIFNSLSIESLDELLYKDINVFLLELKHGNFRDEKIFRKRFGIETKSLTYREIGDIYKLSWQRIEQKKRFYLNKLLIFLRINLKNLKDEIYKLIENSIPIMEKMPKIRELFLNDEDFYLFLENIMLMNYKEIMNLINPEINFKIFEEYISNNMAPYSEEEILNILESNEMSSNEYIYDFKVLNHSHIKKVIIDGNSKYIPLNQTVPTMYAQSALFFPDGATKEDLQEKIKELFNYSPKGRQNLTEERYYWIYLYSSKNNASKFRHISYFYKEFSDDKINEILSEIELYLKYKGSKYINVYQAINYLKEKGIILNYHDLRYMLKKHGQFFETPIYLYGKVDTISLFNKVRGNLKEIIIDHVNKFEQPFTYDEFIEKVKSKENSLTNIFFRLINFGKEIAKVDSTRYSKPDLAFKVINQDIRLKKRLIDHIHDFFKEYKKPTTISFFEKILNNELNLNYHRYWYLSFIRYHKSEFNYIHIHNSNILSLANEPITLSKIVQEGAGLQKNNEELENYIKEKVLSNDREIKAAISSYLSKNNISK